MNPQKLLLGMLVASIFGAIAFPKQEVGSGKATAQARGVVVASKVKSLH
jgi:hypothetical protein